MPFLRAPDHLGIGELAHLLTDRFEGIVESAGADRRGMMRTHQCDQAGTPLGTVAGHHDTFDRWGHARCDLRWCHAEIGQTDDFALAHRNAAEYLREVFAEANADQEVFGFAELANPAHALGVCGKLTDGFDIGCEPSEPVGCPLLAIETRALYLPFW